MRIAMIGQKQTFTRSGGVEVVVTELARRMAALGNEVTCYDRREERGLQVPYVREGVRVVPVRTLDVRGFSALTSSFSATLNALCGHPDIIHYHAEGPCVPLGLVHRAGIRTVATIHGLDWQRAKWGGLASRYIRLGEEIAARKADELVVLTDSTATYFREAYGREAAVIPNGTDWKDSVPARAITERWGLSEDSYVLFLGRLVPEKGLHYLIEAWRGLSTEKFLVVAGASSATDGYVREMLNMASDNPQVLFTGFVEGDVLAELYSNAYAYVLPSNVEGMPLSLLEAMAYGRCCVTSDISECADVLGGTGVTFPRGDIVALRATLASLFTDPSRVRVLGDAARERVRSMYGWDAVTEQTLHVYTKVLS